MTVLFAAAVLAAAVQTPSAAGPDLRAERIVAGQVSIDRALKTVRDLVSLGPRMGGTESGRRAADLVAGLMRSSGLEVTIVEDPPIPTHVETSWLVALEGQPLASAWPYGFSPSIAETTAPVVAEDEGSTDSRGAVVLTRERVGKVYDSLVRAGAVAVLTDWSTSETRYARSAPIAEIDRRTGREAPIPVFGLSYDDGSKLRTAIAAGSSPSVTLSLHSAVGRGTPLTVIGTLPGKGPLRDRILIVCAHGDSDSGGPGADDNASGVAALLEVGRALAWAAKANMLPEDRPTVRLIVWGSEYHSSRAWVASRPGEVSRIDAVFNYDQAGSGAERDAIYFEGNDIPWNEPVLRLLESIAADHAGREGFWTQYTSNPSLGGTDAYSFLPRDHRGSLSADVRIPSTTVFTSAWGTPMTMAQTPGWRSPGWAEEGDLFIDYSAYYHSSGDTPENTTEAEPWNLERCAKLVVLAVRRLMGPAPGPPDR